MPRRDPMIRRATPEEIEEALRIQEDANDDAHEEFDMDALFQQVGAIPDDAGTDDGAGEDPTLAFYRDYMEERLRTDEAEALAEHASAEVSANDGTEGVVAIHFVLHIG